MNTDSIIVHKFGGTSMGRVESFLSILEILEKNKEYKQIVVVSAIGLMTDYLQTMTEYWLNREYSKAQLLWDVMENQCWDLAKKLLDLHQFAQLQTFWNQKRIHIENYNSTKYTAFMAQGEYFSSALLSIKLGQQAQFFDITQVMKTFGCLTQAQADMEQVSLLSETFLKNELHEDSKIIVTQGFIGMDATTNAISLLGRGGSDTTAAILGATLKCSKVFIWTDVDGVFSADPNIVPNSRPIPFLSYDQAGELALYGGKVLHPSCLQYVQRHRISLYVKSTLKPMGLGSVIAAKDPTPQIEEKSNQQHAEIKALVIKKEQLLITIKKLKQLNTYGHLYQIFKILADHQISIEMITTSGQSTSFTLEFPTMWNEQVKQQIAQECQVQLIENRDLGMITFIGYHLAPWIGGPFDYLNAKDVKGVFLGPTQQNLSILMASHVDMEELLLKFHNLFVEKDIFTQTLHTARSNYAH